MDEGKQFAKEEFRAMLEVCPNNLDQSCEMNCVCKYCVLLYNCNKICVCGLHCKRKDCTCGQCKYTCKCNICIKWHETKKNALKKKREALVKASASSDRSEPMMFESVELHKNGNMKPMSNNVLVDKDNVIDIGNGKYLISFNNDVRYLGNREMNDFRRHMIRRDRALNMANNLMKERYNEQKLEKEKIKKIEKQAANELRKKNEIFQRYQQEKGILEKEHREKELCGSVLYIPDNEKMVDLNQGSLSDSLFSSFDESFVSVTTINQSERFSPDNQHRLQQNKFFDALKL